MPERLCRQAEDEASKKRQRSSRDDMSLGDDYGEAPRKKKPDDDEEDKLVKHERLRVRVHQWSMFTARSSLSHAVPEIVLSSAQQAGMDLEDDGGEMEIEEDYEGEDCTTGDGENKVGSCGGVAARGA
jgi:hypothetical protein